MKRFLPVSIVSLLLLAPGCKSSNEAAPAPSAAAAVSAAPAGSAIATAPTASEVPFFVFAEAPDPFYLYPIPGAAFVDAAGFLARLDEGAFLQIPAIMKGLEKGPTGKIIGSWPDGAWLVADDLYKWTRDRWAANQLLRDGEKLLDIAAWSDNRAVAAIAMPNNDMRFFLAGGKGGVVVPSPYPADKAKPAASAVPVASAAPAVDPDAGATDASASDAAAAPAPAPAAAGEGDENKENDNACKVKMKPEDLSLAGLPTGQLYAAGYTCLETGRGDPIVERWEPKKLRGTVEPLPKPESGDVDIDGVLARSPAEVWVFGSAGSPKKPYLARFDGKAWTAEATPFAGGITVLTGEDDGSLWAVVDTTDAASPSALWRKAAGGAWKAVTLPVSGGKPAVAKGLWVRTTGQVWATAIAGDGRGLILSPQPIKTVYSLGSRKTMTDLIATNRRWVASPICNKVYAHLSTLGPSSMDVPKGFGALKEVFSGDPELSALAPIVEDDGAHLYVGVPVPSLAVGQKLLARYKEKNPKAQPNLFCHEPVITKVGIHFE